MKKVLKRIISINDISVFGKCSHTAALPILSAEGIEVCPVITAYLSAHTAFENPVITDMTPSLAPTLSHLDSLGVESDCVFTGYIYTNEQFDTVKKFVAERKAKGNIIITDPVMADDGKLYYPFDNTTVKNMRELCLFADYITPNFTEACLLAGFPVIESVTKRQADSLIARLNTLGINSKIIITGVPFEDGSKVIIEGFNDRAEIHPCEYVEGSFCGTGDVFSAVFTAEILKGTPLSDAIDIARDFVAKAVAETKKAETDFRQGLLFEKFIGSENK